MFIFVLVFYSLILKFCQFLRKSLAFLPFFPLFLFSFGHSCIVFHHICNTEFFWTRFIPFPWEVLCLSSLTIKTQVCVVIPCSRKLLCCEKTGLWRALQSWYAPGPLPSISKTDGSWITEQMLYKLLRWECLGPQLTGERYNLKIGNEKCLARPLGSFIGGWSIHPMGCPKWLWPRSWLLGFAAALAAEMHSPGKSRYLHGLSVINSK